MADDIVTRLREQHASCRVVVGVNQNIVLDSLYTEAADEIERLRTTLTDGYWNVRHVLECANACLVSPHPLWSELNELMETCSSFEKILDILNRWEFIHG